MPNENLEPLFKTEEEISLEKMKRVCAILQPLANGSRTYDQLQREYERSDCIVDGHPGLLLMYPFDKMLDTLVEEKFINFGANKYYDIIEKGRALLKEYREMLGTAT